MSTSGYAQCAVCHSWYSPSAGHTCFVQTAPFQYPTYQMPPQPTLWPTPAPITLEDIRRIVREELDRKPTPNDSTADVQR